MSGAAGAGGGRTEREAFEGFALLELMGHRKLAGFVREATIGGGSFVRIDVYPGQAALPTLTQFYAPGAIYAITPIAEDLARRLAEGQKPAPVTEWDLPRPRLGAGAVDTETHSAADDIDGDDEGDDEC